MPTVLDASAFLAYLNDEPGAERVAQAIGAGATIAAVNLAEVLSRIADHGGDPAAVLRRLVDGGLLEGAVEVAPMTLADAVEVARLRPLTRERGLSLADRACIALAARLGVDALTCDRAWDGLAPGVELRQIR